jgi:hypothetical protein
MDVQSDRQKLRGMDLLAFTVSERVSECVVYPTVAEVDDTLDWLNSVYSGQVKDGKMSEAGLAILRRMMYHDGEFRVSLAGIPCLPTGRDRPTPARAAIYLRRCAHGLALKFKDQFMPGELDAIYRYIVYRDKHACLLESQEDKRAW